jgi:hypothetical protein
VQSAEAMMSADDARFDPVNALTAETIETLWPRTS